MIYHLKTEDIRINALKAVREAQLGLVVEIRKPRRTLPQNDLWHLWIDLMAAQSCCAPADMKVAVKRKILGIREVIDPLTGEVSYTDWESHTMDKEQFSRLMNETGAIAMDMWGLSLPSGRDFV